jgi:hypothetical protein
VKGVDAVTKSDFRHDDNLALATASANITMRFDTTLVQLAMCLASWSSVTAAYPDSAPQGANALRIRQDDKEDSSTTESEKASITKPPASKTSEETKETGKTESKDKDKDKDKDNDKSSGRTTSRSATKTKFGNTVVAGGVTMLDPDPMFTPTPLYRIQDKITWSWNYTSIKAQPSGIDVLISCAAAKDTWTLTTNMTFKTEVEYTWDSKAQATDVEQPLLAELYTLIIKDSAFDITAAPEPGYLAKYTGMTFGMYTPAKETPWSEWDCIGCSAAPSLFDRPALGLALTMSLLSLFSFTWFVTGLGLA